MTETPIAPPPFVEFPSFKKTLDKNDGHKGEEFAKARAGSTTSERGAPSNG